MVKLKRAYEPAKTQDGYRVLVDRLWPRGLRKEQLHVNEWCKELAPSNALRKEFSHDPAKWRFFSSKYRRELRSPEAQAKLLALRKRASRSTVTLVYSARDEEHNNAVALKGVLDGSALRKR